MLLGVRWEAIAQKCKHVLRHFPSPDSSLYLSHLVFLHIHLEMCTNDIIEKLMKFWLGCSRAHSCGSTRDRFDLVNLVDRVLCMVGLTTYLLELPELWDDTGGECSWAHFFQRKGDTISIERVGGVHTHQKVI